MHKKYTRTQVPHEILAKGAVLDFEMGSKPSKWGSREDCLIKNHSSGYRWVEAGTATHEGFDSGF